MNAGTARSVRRGGLAVAAAALVYAALLIPDPAPPRPAGAGRPLFEWRQDAFWRDLEREFVAARAQEPRDLTARIRPALDDVGARLATLATRAVPPADPALAALEEALFRLAPLVAAAPHQVDEYTRLIVQARRLAKELARTWDLGQPAVRDRLYRLLYGTRLALEEVLRQLPTDAPFPAVLPGDDEPSAVPAARLHGLTLRSGDLLVSRGTAPTSALIARGNDYPGAFSHVALAHVEPGTARVTIIESHIECGVTTSPLDTYLRDRKSRLLLLRPRADLPALAADPQLPHRAATAALTEAHRRHIPYDFAMDTRDPGRLFCSEVASFAYASVGLRLWMGVSYISSPTVTAWLASIGVRHFETEEPADLEYDPQLRLVGEWRDRAALFKAHVDDAVTDAMFEAAPPGEPLPYAHFRLPPARLAKAYSAVLNLFGRVGPVPEGMSATAALRAEGYRAAHEAHVTRVLAAAGEFRRKHGYPPPFWELARLARDTVRGAAPRP